MGLGHSIFYITQFWSKLFSVNEKLTVPELYSIAGEVDEALQGGFRWLVFPPRLEAAFERETGAARHHALIVAGMVAIVIHDLFLFTDYTTIPDVFTAALILRLGIITPLAFMLMLLSRRGFTPVIRESVGAFVTLLISLGVVFLVTLSKSPYATENKTGLLLIIIFGNVVYRLRFWYAVVVSLATLAIYAFFFPMAVREPLFVQTGYDITLSACIVFTLFANYNLEQDQRRAYLLTLRDRIGHADLQAINRRLAVLSHKDSLTGIPNRLEFTEYMDQLSRGPQPAELAIIMIDIDHFKLYNDLNGHPAGDQCLHQIAAAMQEAIRQNSDLLARIGGEEFVAVLPGYDLRSARVVAERLCLTVEKLAIPHSNAAKSGVVTISAGIAVATIGAPKDIQSILAAADAALYRAKSAGRNRVEE